MGEKRQIQYAILMQDMPKIYNILKKIEVK